VVAGIPGPSGRPAGPDAATRDSVDGAPWNRSPHLAEADRGSIVSPRRHLATNTQCIRRAGSNDRTRKRTTLPFGRPHPREARRSDDAGTVAGSASHRPCRRHIHDAAEGVHRTRCISLYPSEGQVFRRNGTESRAKSRILSRLRERANQNNSGWIPVLAYGCTHTRKERKNRPAGIAVFGRTTI
jgi:hypothetical protein